MESEDEVEVVERVRDMESGYDSMDEYRGSGQSEASIRAKAQSIVRRAAQATARGDLDTYYSILEEEQEYGSRLTPDEINYYNQCALEYGQSLMGGY